MTGEDVLILFEGEQPSERFDVWTESPRERGWVTLARLAPCPGGCANGEVWQGSSDLASCHVCDGGGMVEVGIGGAYLSGSYRHQIPEEPDLYEYRNDLRHFIAAASFDIEAPSHIGRDAR